MTADLLINAERSPGDRPPPGPPEPSPEPAPWLGSATSEIDHWKKRALSAEAVIAELRRGLARPGRGAHG